MRRWSPGSRRQPGEPQVSIATAETMPPLPVACMGFARRVKQFLSSRAEIRVRQCSHGLD